MLCNIEKIVNNKRQQRIIVGIEEERSHILINC